MGISDRLGHPAVLTGVGTVLGYGVVLAVLTAIVFGLPYLAVVYV